MMKITTVLPIILARLIFTSNLNRPDDIYPEWSKNFNSLEKTQIGPACQTFAVINALRVCLTYSDPNAEQLDAQKYFDNCSYKDSNRFVHKALDEIIEKPPTTIKGDKKVILESKSKGIKYNKEIDLGRFGVGNFSLENSSNLLKYLDDALKEGPVLSSIDSLNLNYDYLTRRDNKKDFSSPLIKDRQCTNDPNKDNHNHAIVILNYYHKHPVTNEQVYEIFDSNVKYPYFLTKAELIECAMHELFSIKCSKVKLLDIKKKKRRLTSSSQ